MEKGSFQFLHTSKVDFTETSNKADNISKENLKSGVVQALLSQNEDLAARLKVALQRLSTTEDRNQTLEEQSLQLRHAHTISSDQVLIWKEKENAWKTRNEGINKELQTFKTRFPDYLKMEDTIERYKRYHERVKTQIKPYIQELKDYAKTLHSQIIEIHSELEKKDSEINDLQKKNKDVRNYFNLQIEAREQAQKQLTSEFEAIREQLQHENSALQEANSLLNSKSLQMDRALERQDELENIVIAIRRSKEEYQRDIHSEIEELRKQNRDYKSLLAERDLLVCDLKNEMQRLRLQLSV